ncbi:type VI secretion system membrane subunit TssM [Pseudomonas synxantha]|uniref:Type VI secretion system membrane subunit TssM n=2 Tax=Pseudomonas synxantha TaxID=47883 RepID=A0A5D3G181_9PSED|nr:type VI secretion system membrane subunit TssM [Pseudomonas synxantha]
MIGVMLLRFFKTLSRAAVMVAMLYWVTVLVRDYGPRLSIDGSMLFTETWQQWGGLLTLYVGGLIWFCWRWSVDAQRAKHRALEVQVDLEKRIAPCERELQLREQLTQWRLETQVEGVRPAFLLFDLHTTSNVDLRIERVGRYSVLTVSGRLLSEAESRRWQCLLDELKGAKRDRCALVGGLLLLNAQKLLGADDGQELQALSLRERLEELARAIGKGLPIQTIVSHCSSLPGYVPSIMGLQGEERDLAIGFSLGTNQSNLLRLTERMGNRLETLDDSLLDRLQREPLTLLRTQLYGFSPLWRLFSGHVQVFLQAVFHDQARLQSLRFTAGDLAEDVQGATSSTLLLRTLQQCERHGAWRMFLKHSAGWVRSHARVCLILIVAGVCAFLAHHYHHQARMLDKLAEQREALFNLRQGGLERLTLLTDMVDVSQDKGWLPSLQLNQQQRLVTLIQTLYEQALSEVIAQPLANALEERINSPKSHAYDNLRLYLMLGGQGRLDTDFVARELKVLSDQRLPQPQREWLNAHLQRVVQSIPAAALFSVNDALVEQAREHISREPVAQRVYRQLSTLLRNLPHKELSVATEIGTGGLMLFASRSGRSMTQGVPWLFTLEGYTHLNQRLERFIAEALRDESWVMGAARQQAPHHVRAEILGLYQRDYVRHWEYFVSDLKVAGLNEPEQLPGRLERLSQQEGALSRLLQLIDRETRLSLNAENEGILKRLRERTVALKIRLGVEDNAKDILNDASEQSAVTQHFASFHRLTESVEGRPSLLDQLREALAYAGGYLSAREASTASGLSPPAVNALERLDSLTSTFPLLIRPLLSDIVKVGKGWVRTHQSVTLTKKWAQDLGPYCERVVQQRYPFDRNASTDVPLEAFNQLFAADGLLQTFGRFYPGRHKDESTLLRPDNRAVEGDEIDPLVLLQFDRAEHIGKVFFPAGAAQAHIDFEVSPVTMDEEIASFSLIVDDRQLSYSHGPILPSLFTWPSQVLGTRLNAVVTLLDGRTIRQSQEGTWAWFRLIDQGLLSAGPTADTQWLTLSFDGYNVVLQIRSAGLEQPFGDANVRAFRCPYSLGT